MNDAEFEQLEATERALWADIQAAKEAIRPREDAWLKAHIELGRARLKREVLAEMQTNPSEERV